MTISLPDVNVWIALAAEGHIHHVPAREWFAAQPDASVAFCRITQMGLLRLLTNPNVMGRAKAYFHTVKCNSRCLSSSLSTLPLLTVPGSPADPCPAQPMAAPELPAQRCRSALIPWARLLVTYLVTLYWTGHNFCASDRNNPAIVRLGAGIDQAKW